MENGNGIKKAAENAMEDLAGLSEPADDAHTPDPGNPNDPVNVHSSISEGSNAIDADEPGSAGNEPRGSADGVDRTGAGTSSTDPHPDPTENPSGTPPESPSVNPPENPMVDPDNLPLDNPQSVPGPGGLPDSDPDSLAADPSETGEDPTTSMGRG